MGNLTAYHMHVLQLKAPTIKFPIFSSIIERGEDWDLTDWRAQWVVHLNFAKFKSPPIPQHCPGGGVVGHNIDRCITLTQNINIHTLTISCSLFITSGRSSEIRANCVTTLLHTSTPKSTNRQNTRCQVF